VGAPGGTNPGVPPPGGGPPGGGAEIPDPGAEGAGGTAALATSPADTGPAPGTTAEPEKGLTPKPSTGDVPAFGTGDVPSPLGGDGVTCPPAGGTPGFCEFDTSAEGFLRSEYVNWSSSGSKPPRATGDVPFAVVTRTSTVPTGWGGAVTTIWSSFLMSHAWGREQSMRTAFCTGSSGLPKLTDKAPAKPLPSMVIGAPPEVKSPGGVRRWTVGRGGTGGTVVVVVEVLLVVEVDVVVDVEVVDVDVEVEVVVVAPLRMPSHNQLSPSAPKSSRPPNSMTPRV